MSSAKKNHFFNDSNSALPRSDGEVPSIIEIEPAGPKIKPIKFEDFAVIQNQDVIDVSKASVEANEHTVTIWAANLVSNGDMSNQVVDEELFNVILKLSKQPTQYLSSFIQARPKSARTDLFAFLERLSVRDEAGRWVLKNGVRLAIEVLGFESVVQTNVSDPSKVADQVYALNDYQRRTGFGIADLKKVILAQPENWVNEMLAEEAKLNLKDEANLKSKPVLTNEQKPKSVASLPSLADANLDGQSISHFPIDFHFAVDTAGKK